MNVAVVLGGLSAERAVSYESGFAVGEGLVAKGHTVTYIDPAKGRDCVILKSKSHIDTLPPIVDMSSSSLFIDAFATDVFSGIDCAFNVMHGTLGEDGVLQSLFELKGIPYTGSGSSASAVAMDKIISKLLFLGAGVNTAQWSVVNKQEISDLELLDDIIAELGNNLVVKPNGQGSAVGVEILLKANKYSLQEALNKSIQFGKKLIVEQYIAGRELTVGVLNGEALPIVEIKPNDGHYDYQNKYQKGATEYICPADLPEDIVDFTKTMAERAHGVLGCEDYSRVDFRLNEEGQPFCLEVNTVPGFTELSLFPMAAKESGIDFPTLVEELVLMALDRHKES